MDWAERHSIEKVTHTSLITGKRQNMYFLFSKKTVENISLHMHFKTIKMHFQINPLCSGMFNDTFSWKTIVYTYGTCAVRVNT